MVNLQGEELRVEGGGDGADDCNDDPLCSSQVDRIFFSLGHLFHYAVQRCCSL